MTNRRTSSSGAGAAAAATPSASASSTAPVRELETFLNDLDPRALLWMFSNLEDRPLDQLVAVQADQVRRALSARTEIDVNAWHARTLEFLGGAANEIDWTPFAGLAPPGQTGAAAAGQPGQTGAAGVQAPGAGAGAPAAGAAAGVAPDVTQQLLAVMLRIEAKLDDKAGAPAATTDLGRKRHRAKALLDGLRDLEVRSDEEAEKTDPEPEPKKPKKGSSSGNGIDMLDAVRKYYDGSQPLTDRQHLVRLEMSKLPLDSISAFFGALRRVASTIEAGEGEYRRFTETMTLTEQMVHDLFGEAVRQQQFLSAKNRDALESKFVTLLKAKMLSAKDFSFVKAAADAQQTIMKDMKDISRDNDRRGDDLRRVPGGPNPNPTCFECGKRGHKSFECKADEATRKAHKEARAARRG